MYVYLTKNMVNGMMYIGKREQYSPEGSMTYFGSGTLISKDIKKYGKNNFVKCILQRDILTRELVNELEKHFIRIYAAVKSDNFYNKSSGGNSLNGSKPGRKAFSEKERIETFTK